MCSVHGVLFDALRMVQLFELEGVVDVSCCRLVKYDDFTESLERSYEGEEAHSMVFVLDGVKSAYNFDFMLETRLPGQTFLPYKLGGWYDICCYVSAYSKQEITG